MAIVLTDKEKEMLKSGEMSVSDIISAREQNPEPEPVSVNLNELDAIKQEIRDTNILYKDSIQKNKDLYEELQVNRKRKEELRNKIAELRIKKKQILGKE